MNDRQSAAAGAARDARFDALNSALIVIALVSSICATTHAASAETCGGNPLGIARTIAVDPLVLAQVGTAQFPQTLPLADHEVVLTFDDGPSPATTGKILDALDAACVKANFFVMGAHAALAPDLVLRAASAGHTIGTHTQTHPALPDLSAADAEAEIARGIAATAAALSPEHSVAPFFRAPYLATTPVIDEYLRAHHLMLWSVDVDSEDWRDDSADNVRARIFERLDRVGKGIILMHDVQPATAQALPALLQDLKARGYKIVHVVPSTLTAGAVSAR